MYDHERRERRRPKKLQGPIPQPPEDSELVEPMIAYLQRRGLNPELAIRNGWYPSMEAGDERARIVIPATEGFWQARLIDASEEGEARRYQSPHAPRGTSVIVLWPDPYLRPEVIITEGPFDALAAAGLGCRGVALMGNTPTKAVLERIAIEMFLGAQYVVMADADAPAAATHIALSLMVWGRRARVVFPPAPYKDLAEVPPNRRAWVLGIE